jgi:hypothetical protein
MVAIVTTPCLNCLKHIRHDPFQTANSRHLALYQGSKVVAVVCEHCQEGAKTSRIAITRDSERDDYYALQYTCIEGFRTPHIENE